MTEAIWQIRRWNGRSGVKREVVFEGVGEIARAEYDRRRASMLHGTIELAGQAGSVVAHTWAPGIETRRRPRRV